MLYEINIFIKIFLTFRESNDLLKLLYANLQLAVVDGCCTPQGSPCSRRSFESKGKYFEGDIILPIGAAKNHINSAASRWPSGTVPYVIEGTWSE